MILKHIFIFIIAVRKEYLEMILKGKRFCPVVLLISKELWLRFSNLPKGLKSPTKPTKVSIQNI